MSNDLFIRRIYTHKGISVAVDIDLVKKEISLVDKMGDDSFKDKNWYFTHRGLEYLGGWILILDAMKYAITEASKELEAAKDRDEKKFIELVLSVNKALDEPTKATRSRK